MLNDSLMQLFGLERVVGVGSPFRPNGREISGAVLVFVFFQPGIAIWRLVVEGRD